MFLGLLLACASDGEEFARAQADALCAWHERCDSLEVGGWSDLASCEEQLQHAVELRAANGELGCEGYDAAAADACLAVYAEVACDAIPDLAVCEEVCREG